MLYPMWCSRQDKIIQVASLCNNVFSGQPKLVHKFGLNLANHFEPQKGKKKIYKSKCFALAFSKWNTFPFRTMFCFVVKPRVLTFSKAQRRCAFNENKSSISCFLFIYLSMKIHHPTAYLRPSPLCSPLLSDQSQSAKEQWLTQLRFYSS